jgi:glutamine synthetase
MAADRPGAGPAPLKDPAEAVFRDFLERWPETRTVDLILPDLVGVARGKRMPKASLAAALEGGLGFPSSVYALDTTGANVDASGLIWEEGDANRPVILDLATLAPVPWRAGGTQILGGLQGDDGGPFFADPRAVLQKVVDRLAVLGLTPTVALELEFYLLPESHRPGRGPPHPIEHGAIQVYGMDDLEAKDAFFATLDGFAEAQGLPAKGAVAEYAPGQFEVNLGHVSPALTAADHAFMLKRAVKAAARAHDLSATFMAKPFADQAANGLHVHVSLLDADGHNRFAADEAALHQALGGLQATMAEAMLIFAPNANSYRRLRPRSYAPLAPSWGYNNRTVALRIPDGPLIARRIEHRVAGADANPYLALAAVLAGIHHGLEAGLDPGPPITGNAYDQVEPSLPTSWERAIDAMAAAERLPAYLGTDFCRLFRICRAAERDRYDDVISPIEYSWYQDTV